MTHIPKRIDLRARLRNASIVSYACVLFGADAQAEDCLQVSETTTLIRENVHTDTDMYIRPDLEHSSHIGGRSLSVARYIPVPSFLEEGCQYNERPAILDYVPIKPNKRLKLGTIFLDLKLPSAGQKPSRIGQVFTHQDRQVLVAINSCLGDVFYRSDLTRILKNKMPAREIEEILVSLVKLKVVEKLEESVKTERKVGRSRTERYKKLWSKEQLESLGIHEEATETHALPR